MSTSADADSDANKPDPQSVTLTDVNKVFLAVLVLGLIAALAAARSWSHAPVVAVWSLACLAVGAFIGLLFGVPRTGGKPDANPAAPAATGNGGAAPRAPESNNNLVEVSDWLTKIIVGVGLVQLGSIPHNLRTMARPLATCLGDNCGLAVAVGIIVFFTTAGFLAGYINARTVIAMMLREADSLKDRIDAVAQKVTAIEDNAILPGKKQAPPPPAASTRFFVESLTDDAIKPSKVIIDPDDPNKGQFGGRAEVNSRILEAKITPKGADNSAACWVEITVRSTEPNAHPLTGEVIFHLHPTFGRDSRYEIPVQDGVARDRILSWGAFTVGAEADGGNTRLELDLVQVRGGTTKFYQS